MPLPSIDGASCAMCHQALVQKKVVHAPVAAAGGCLMCHQGSTKDGKTEFTLAAKGDALCFTCHGDKQELLKKTAVHAPFQGMGCTTCHTPHSADAAKLLTAEMPGLCLTCHGNMKVDEKAGALHPPFMAGGCAGCHGVHATDVARLLLKPGNEVCSTCHDKETYQRHPISGHPTSGKQDMSRPGKELSCTSCHQPHQSKFKRLFYSTDSTMMMCVECHSKGKKPIR